jgi:hypothetical protein
METARVIPSDLARLGEACAKMGSPFFGALLERAAAAYETDATLHALLERHADRSRIGLRLGGAAHYRALRGLAPKIAAHYRSTGGDGDVDAAWQAILDDIHAHVREYDVLFERQVQTNEVARALPVLGAMLALTQATRLPLRIFEIGSSAGLVLNFDRYRYAGEGWTWGDIASPVKLQNRTASGAPRYLDAPLRVLERRGCDLHPLDASNDEDAYTLLGFIWPDQRERFERLRAAIEVARAHRPDIASGDGIAWARNTASPRDGTATAVLHTVITEHMTADVRAPFAWIRMELGEGGYDTLLTQWPGASETLIAKSDGHAQNLLWFPGAHGESSC